jgi:hypothetical protein
MDLPVMTNVATSVKEDAKNRHAKTCQVERVAEAPAMHKTIGLCAVAVTAVAICAMLSAPFVGVREAGSQSAMPINDDVDASKPASSRA